MKYSAPLNAWEEVRELVAAGADELYCGYLDAWWIERYGDHDSASRRQGRANFSQMDDLLRAADAAQSLGVPLFLALNSRYTELQLDHLEELCEAFADNGGSGIIASDLGLLWRLRDHRSLARTLSLLAVVQNTPTVLAYAQLGISRIVFPRFIGPDEAANLLAAAPGMQGEVMAFFDKCPMVDGYCRHRHGVSYPDRVVAQGIDDAPPLYTFDTMYRTHACLGASCEYLEPYPCAACFLPQFQEARVGYAKLGGRGRPLEERVRALRFLKEAEAQVDDAARADLYRRTFGIDCACYYGLRTQNRYAIEPVELPPSLLGQVTAENGERANGGGAAPSHGRKATLASDDLRSCKCEGFEGSNGARKVVGSQTNFNDYRLALDELCEGKATHVDECLAFLVPPLSDEDLGDLIAALPILAARWGDYLRLYANDLGTYAALKRAINQQGLEIELDCGSLLARCDNPAEVAHFLSPEQNPPRPIWGPEGEPCVLVYREPPEALQEHWRHPSFSEPSSQAALQAIVSC